MRQRLPPKIAEVARVAGVSVGTVSNVLNGGRAVRPVTAAAVEKAMLQLGYVPNHAATSLRKGRSQTLGLVIPDIANPYFGELAKGAQDASGERNLSLLIASSGPKADESRQLSVLRSRGVDGLLYAGADALGDASLASIAEHMPTVLIGVESESIHADSVIAHDEQGGSKVGEHLASLGHRNVLVLQGREKSWTTVRRLRGFRQAFERTGTRVETAHGSFQLEVARAYVAKSLENGPPWYTAIFATNDLMAVGAMQALYAAGYHIPRDMSVVGYDDVPIAGMLNPALTTVGQPVYRLGYLGAERLIARILGEQTPERVHMVLDVNLVIRSSTATVRYSEADQPPRRS